MADQKTLSSGIWIGTKRKYLEEFDEGKLDPNKSYYITDLEAFALSESEMEAAVNGEGPCYQDGDIYISTGGIDPSNEKYRRGTFYVFKRTTTGEGEETITTYEWNELLVPAVLSLDNEFTGVNTFTDLNADNIKAASGYIGTNENTDALVVNGNLKVLGDFEVSGASVETKSSKLLVSSDYITLRDDKNYQLSNGQYSGIISEYYDGTNSGGIVFNNKGTAYVGDVSIKYAESWELKGRLEPKPSQADAIGKFYRDPETGAATEFTEATDPSLYDLINDFYSIKEKPAFEESVGLYYYDDVSRDYIALTESEADREKYNSAAALYYDYIEPREREQGETQDPVQPIATRDEAENMDSNSLVFWDGSNTKLKTNPEFFIDRNTNEVEIDSALKIGLTGEDKPARIEKMQLESESYHGLVLTNTTSRSHGSVMDINKKFIAEGGDPITDEATLKLAEAGIGIAVNNKKYWTIGKSINSLNGFGIYNHGVGNDNKVLGTALLINAGTNDVEAKVSMSTPSIKIKGEKSWVLEHVTKDPVASSCLRLHPESGSKDFEIISPALTGGFVFTIRDANASSGANILKPVETNASLLGTNKNIFKEVYSGKLILKTVERALDDTTDGGSSPSISFTDKNDKVFANVSAFTQGAQNFLELSSFGKESDDDTRKRAVLQLGAFNSFEGTTDAERTKFTLRPYISTGYEKVNLGDPIMGFEDLYLSGKINLNGQELTKDNVVVTDKTQTISSTKYFDYFTNSGKFVSILGTAANKPFRVRSVVGQTSEGTSLDNLYLNYGVAKPVMWGETGQSSLNSNGSITAASNITTKGTLAVENTGKAVLKLYSSDTSTASDERIAFVRKSASGEVTQGIIRSSVQSSDQCLVIQTDTLLFDASSTPTNRFQIAPASKKIMAQDTSVHYSLGDTTHRFNDIHLESDIHVRESSKIMFDASDNSASSQIVYDSTQNCIKFVFR